MKKIFAFILALTALCTCFACGGDKYANLKIDVNGIGQNIVNNSQFEFPLDVAEDPTFVMDVLKLDENTVNVVEGKPEIFYAVSAASPEAVFVIGAKDAASAKTISEGPIKDWIKYNKDSYASYGADQVPKLNSCVNMTAGRYVFVIVSNDNTAAKSTLTRLLDTAIKING